MKKIILIAVALFANAAMLNAQKKAITLSAIFQNHTFRSDYIAAFNSMRDGRYYTALDGNGNLVKKNFVTGAVEAILVHQADVKNEKGDIIPLQDFSWSADEKQLLIAVGREYIYRRSSKAVMYSYNLETKKATTIDEAKILHASYSPQGDKVAFVKNNNLFFKDLISNKTTQVTTDGKWNYIINGNCDWVYEEEFSFTQAYQWSPNGAYLAYYRFDETNVPTYAFAVYDSLYPTQYTYKYPKAGEKNSTIEIRTYQLANARTIKMDIGSDTDIYIPRIYWMPNDNQLAIVWLNRLQNEMRILQANATTGQTSMLYEEQNKYYVDINNQELQFLKDGKHYIISNEKDGYKHIYLATTNAQKNILLTAGNYDVDRIIGIDEKNKKMYFTAAYHSPMTRDFCAVDLDGTNFKLMDNRIGTHNVAFNADYTYYVDEFSTLTTPPVVGIYNTEKQQLVKSLMDNHALVDTISKYDISTPRFLTIPNGKGDSLNAWILQPSNFDKTKRYPVLFCNYGGPNSQSVADQWGTVSFWHQMLAEKGYIVVCVDNTGTGYRGEAFRKKTYLQMGKYEIEDQIAAAKYLGTLPYVDAKRIGHWGWSFGGFMSSLAITKGADIFSMAVAVAPVTNWRFYDNIYTERYMRTPQENAKGYDDNSPLNFTDKIKGKFLMIHGTADDNVHFQNSTMMVTAMVKNNIEFESGYYPDKNHRIRGGNTSYHLYNKMTKFILANL